MTKGDVTAPSEVALRKESVDRNAKYAYGRINDISVALRKESVDRNTCWTSTTRSRAPSLSARRAWIEMRSISKARAPSLVALRKESVDRNAKYAYGRINDISSLSARRAWIEMRIFTNARQLVQSLSARRAWIEILVG